MTNQEITNITLESLRDWFKKEKWVRISTSGNIAGPCGTSKNKKNPDRCLPKAKAQSLSKAERAATARKKKKAGKKGKTVVANTKKAKVTREMKEQWPEEIHSRHKEFIFKLIKVGSDRAKYSVTDIETGEQKGTIVFNTVSELQDFANDYIKPQGGRQSSHFGTQEDIRNLVVGLIHEIQGKDVLMEKDDRCTRIAKRKYDTWPSAYASGAVVRCRRGEIWKNESLSEAVDYDIETIIKLVKSANNPKNLPISFGSTSVAIGGTQYDKGELVTMFNGRELGMDAMDIRTVFFNAQKNAEEVADKINASDSGVTAEIGYGYAKKPILYLKRK